MPLVKAQVAASLKRNIKEGALRHTMELSMDFHNDKSSAEVVEVMNLGEPFVNLMDYLLFDTMPSIIDIITITVYLSHFIDGYIGLIAIAVVILQIWAELAKNPKLFQMRQDHTTMRCRESRIKYEAIKHWELVISANCQDYENRQLSSVLSDFIMLMRRMSWLRLFANLAEHVTKTIGLVIAVWLLVLRITKGLAPLGSLFILIQSWPSIFEFVNFNIRSYDILMDCLSSGERFSKLLQARPSVVDKEGATSLKVTAGRVEFTDISFSYADGDRPAMNKISFTVEGGKTVALVGRSGSGKSTVFKLLQRLIDPNEGDIKIDGQNTRDVTLSSLRDNIAIVPQSLDLPNKSIKEIVAYGLNAKANEIEEACKAACIHDRIIGFETRYDTKVGEEGVKLSGGERQRIAIARAILKNPKILLLDEATSAVDNLTEVPIRESLKSQAEGRTTLIIAHRLNTIRDADEIIVLEKGEVAERGSHTGLLSRRGLYYDMWTSGEK